MAKKAAVIAVAVMIVALAVFTTLFLKRTMSTGNQAGRVPISGTQMTGSTGEEITDWETINWLWTEYLFDSFDTFAGYEFDGPNSNSLYKSLFVQYVVKRMAMQQNPDITSMVQKTVDFILPDLDKIKAELIRYFNSDFSLTQDEYTEVYQTGSGTAVSLYLTCINFTDTESSPYRLHTVTYQKSSRTYQIIVDFYANKASSRISSTKTYRLARRSEKELYFTSVKIHRPEVTYVNLQGGYVKLEKSFGEGLPLDDQRLLFKSILNIQKEPSISEDQDSCITQTVMTLVDANTLQPVKTLEIVDTDQKKLMGVRVTPDKLILKYNDSYECTDKDLNKLEKSMIKLPGFIKKLADQGYQYDVSNDLKTIVFVDTVGLNIYSRRTGESILIHRHVYQYGLVDNIPKSKISCPQYAYNDKSIVSRLVGWESLVGTLVTQMDESGFQNIFLNQRNPYYEYWTNIPFNAPYTFWDDSGQLSGISVHPYDSIQAGTDASGVKPILFIDELARSKVYLDYDASVDFAVFNNAYFAHVTLLESFADSAENRYGVVVIDLSTMKAKTVLTMTAAIPYLHAVTNNGRVLLSYSYGDEAGTLITDKPDMG